MKHILPIAIIFIVSGCAASTANIAHQTVQQGDEAVRQYNDSPLGQLLVPGQAAGRAAYDAANLANKIGSSEEREQAAGQAAYDSHQSNTNSHSTNIGR